MYYCGKKISELSKLALNELKENIALDVEDYIERNKLFDDGEYKLIIPFKNGEAVEGKLIIRDILVEIKFDKNAKIRKYNYRPRCIQEL